MRKSLGILWLKPSHTALFGQKPGPEMLKNRPKHKKRISIPSPIAVPKGQISAFWVLLNM